MDAAEPQPQVPLRKGRWYQYGLRTLLTLMFLASVGMSWVAVRMRSATREEEAVRALSQCDGFVHYAPLWSSSPRPQGHFPGPVWLRRLLGNGFFVQVVSVDLDQDAGLPYLGNFPQLRSLWLGYHGRICGGTEPYFEQLRQQSGITDASLQSLHRLKQLESLHLELSRISDNGLVHLKGLTELETLGLAQTRIGDAGLVHLTGLAQLRQLNLSSTRVTDQGVEQLQRALPNCKITR